MKIWLDIYKPYRFIYYVAYFIDTYLIDILNVLILNAMALAFIVVCVLTETHGSRMTHGIVTSTLPIWQSYEYLDLLFSLYSLIFVPLCLCHPIHISLLPLMGQTRGAHLKILQIFQENYDTNVMSQMLNQKLRLKPLANPLSIW